MNFEALVGDDAVEWPTDVTVTPRGSLTAWIVMPYMPDGNLLAFLRDEEPLQDEAAFADMLSQLLKAVVVLVDNRLLHRDLKLDNVLVRRGDAGSEYPTLLLTDFGTLASFDDMVRRTLMLCMDGLPLPLTDYYTYCQ
jgi:serine/threonine protein kinase